MLLSKGSIIFAELLLNHHASITIEGMLARWCKHSWHVHSQSDCFLFGCVCIFFLTFLQNVNVMNTNEYNCNFKHIFRGRCHRSLCVVSVSWSKEGECIAKVTAPFYMKPFSIIWSVLLSSYFYLFCLKIAVSIQSTNSLSAERLTYLPCCCQHAPCSQSPRKCHRLNWNILLDQMHWSRTAAFSAVYKQTYCHAY